jgi:hypothetical protein
MSKDITVIIVLLLVGFVIFMLYNMMPRNNYSSTISFGGGRKNANIKLL